MTTRKSHKARGANFETDIRDSFRSRGYDAERLARPLAQILLPVDNPVEDTP